MPFASQAAQINQPGPPQQAMAIPMGDDGLGEAEAEMPVDQSEDIAQLLAGLQALGVDVQADPTGSVILSGVPASILGQFGASEVAPVA